MKNFINVGNPDPLLVNINDISYLQSYGNGSRIVMISNTGAGNIRRIDTMLSVDKIIRLIEEAQNPKKAEKA